MFGTIRIILCSILLMICILLLKKKRKLKKKNVIIAIAVIVLLCTLSGIVPVENYFFTFSTPEKAFNYMYSEKPVLVIDGKETSLVVGREATDDYIYLVLPKCSKGWKLGRGIDTKLKEQILNEEMVIALYQYKETEDCYITILDISGKEADIFDSCNSTFVAFDGGGENMNATLYFSHVSNYDGNYWIKINDEKYVL